MNAQLQTQLDALLGERIVGYEGSDHRVTIKTQSGREVTIIMQPAGVYPSARRSRTGLDCSDLPLMEVREKLSIVDALKASGAELTARDHAVAA